MFGRSVLRSPALCLHTQQLSCRRESYTVSVCLFLPANDLLTVRGFISFRPVRLPSSVGRTCLLLPAVLSIFTRFATFLERQFFWWFLTQNWIFSDLLNKKKRAVLPINFTSGKNKLGNFILLHYNLWNLDIPGPAVHFVSQKGK